MATGPSARCQTHAAHQPCDPLAADPAAPSTEFGMHARAAVPAATDLVSGPDLSGKDAVVRGPRALGPARPGVVAAPAHAQHLTHDLDGKVGDVVLDEHVAHLRSVAWPKMSAARFKMSRSIRARSSSLRSRAIFAAWSAGVAPTRRVGAACALEGASTDAPLASAGYSSAQRSQ